MRVGVAGGGVVFGGAQRGDWAAGRQHWPVLKAASKGGGGGRGGRRREVDLSMGS